LGKLLLEDYDHKGMKESRKGVILKAREAKSWGIVLGGDYPMDYYAQDGGEWNSSYMKKNLSRPVWRNV
jgi:hypothetical protein